MKESSEPIEGKLKGCKGTPCAEESESEHAEARDGTGSDEDSDGELEFDGEAVTLDGDGRIAGYEGNVDFSFRVFPGAIAPSAEELARLTEDCREVFCGQTFWLPATATPRCTFEHLARSVFRLHTEQVKYDDATSGAEWWVQVREDEDAEKPIDFHWDKDEGLVDMQGLHVTPHVSTVTYLCDVGAPTVVLEAARDGDDEDEDEEVKTSAIPRAHMCFPKMGTHLSFDGRFLHGAPPVFARQTGALRLTFLVNVWLNYQPITADRFPEEALEMVGKEPLKEARFGDVTPLAPTAISTGDREFKAHTFAFGPTNTEHRVELPIPVRIPSSPPAVSIEFGPGSVSKLHLGKDTPDCEIGDDNDGDSDDDDEREEEDDDDADGDVHDGDDEEGDRDPHVDTDANGDSNDIVVDDDDGQQGRGLKRKHAGA